ncbi:unnamed protein product [Notodromas monacha]|uniref:TM2 domain-containing protein n=1 Tax=Notodromas monacha TaxID=399045 RepID=A0A7R9G7Y6_9CRUS|nr:unnamed protein product [Notodromas monacha]CAG0912561.1 unnamed protein product [Notodromas monacha]
MIKWFVFPSKLESCLAHLNDSDAVISFGKIGENGLSTTIRMLSVPVEKRKCEEGDVAMVMCTGAGARYCRASVERLKCTPMACLMRSLVLLVSARIVSAAYVTHCRSELRPGQYLCLDLNIDPATQQPRGCTPENWALVNCTAADGIVCNETGNSTFEKEIPCEWTNGYSFETALLLSVFFGMFGADRFYLGYPAIGVLKFCTLGFMFFGQLVDVILIATQVLLPSDGSHYVISYYGPKLKILGADNETLIYSRELR